MSGGVASGGECEAMKFRKAYGEEPKVELMMTPMIDIVFQLLVFFAMTFKPRVVEGQFEIHMPKGAPVAAVAQDLVLPDIKVRLVADAKGNLARTMLGEQVVRGPQDLAAQLKGLVGGIAGEVEAEIDADEHLHYEYVVQAINACTASGLRKIKFSPPKAKSGVSGEW